MTGHMIPHGYTKTSQRSTKNTCNITKTILSTNSRTRSRFLTKRTKGETSIPVTRTCLSRLRSLPVLWRHLLRPKMHKVNNSLSLLHLNPSKSKRRPSISLTLMLLQSLNKRTRMISTTFSQRRPATQITRTMASTISNLRNPLWADKMFNNKPIICLDISRR